jgi:hypothetical protein
VTHGGEALFVDFRITPLTTKSPDFDLDSLLDTVFSVVINSRGWFGWRQPNLRWAKFGLLHLDGAVQPLSSGQRLHIWMFVA